MRMGGAVKVSWPLFCAVSVRLYLLERNPWNLRDGLFSWEKYRTFQQAAGLSASSPRSCGLYSPIPNVFSGLTPFPIVFHRSSLLSASSILVEMSPSERLCFLTAKVYGNSGNERVPASGLCPVKNNAVVRPPQHFFRPKLFWFPFPVPR